MKKRNPMTPTVHLLIYYMILILKEQGSTSQIQALVPWLRKKPALVTGPDDVPKLIVLNLPPPPDTPKSLFLTVE